MRFEFFDWTNSPPIFSLFSFFLLQFVLSSKSFFQCFPNNSVFSKKLSYKSLFMYFELQKFQSRLKTKNWENIWKQISQNISSREMRFSHGAQTSYIYFKRIFEKIAFHISFQILSPIGRRSNTILWIFCPLRGVNMTFFPFRISASCWISSFSYLGIFWAKLYYTSFWDKFGMDINYFGMYPKTWKKVWDGSQVKAFPNPDHPPLAIFLACPSFRTKLKNLCHLSINPAAVKVKVHFAVRCKIVLKWSWLLAQYVFLVW